MDLEYCPYCMSPVKPGEPCGTCKLTAGSYTPAARHLPPGTVLQGRYLLGRVLGEGGFGITYIGRDLVLGLKVAVKEYFPADKATRDAGTSTDVSSYMGNSSSLYLRGKANFLREAQTIARLDRQPNIVSVKDFFEANNTAYIVMEYIDGTTFKDLVDQRGGKLPAWELLHLIEPMFGALSAIHGLGLIHRDISPENLMLEQGTVRLLDFGCARESANGDATMTIMLRHGYAPLEQYQSSSEGQGEWTDIYALSATIYYCITGKKPPQAMDRLLEDGLVPPRKLGVDLTERQEKALLKGLSVLPRARFRSAEEFHTALYEGVGPAPRPVPEPVDPEPEPEPKPKPKPAQEPEPAPGNRLLAWLKEHKKAAGIGAAALLAVVVIGAAVAAGLPHDPGPTPGPGSSSEPDPTGQPDSSSGPFNPAYVYDWNMDSRFEELMNDDSVSVIIIAEGQNVSIDRPMELTKPIKLELSAQLNINAEVTISSPVQIEPHARLHINSEVTLSSTVSVPQYADFLNFDRLTVTGGGQIRVDGYYGGDGLLRTVDGGAISIGGTGHADFGTLWLERAGDLDADSSQFGLDQRRYIVADEDTLFENAAHVNSFEELENAASDRRTNAIVVDGSLTMERWLIVSKPILIGEGVVLTARFGESGFIFGDVAVNRGRVECEIQFNDGGVYLNYGGTDTLLGNGTNGSGCILNLSEIRIRFGTYRNSSIVNLGRITLDGDSSDDRLTILDGIMMNYGGIDLVSGSLQLRGNGYLANFGTVRVSADAGIENNGYIYTGGSGELTLEGVLWNNGGLEYDRKDNLVLRGGSIEGGMILTWEGRSRLENSGSVHNAAILVRRNYWDEDLDETQVESAEVLLSKIEYNKSRKLILRVTGDVFVDGDLTVTNHDLVVDGSLEVTGRLTVSGGMLSNHGTLTVGSLELRSGALLDQNGGLLRLNGGTLALYDSDAVICSEIDLGGGRLELNHSIFFNINLIRNIGGILVDNGEHQGSYLFNWTGMELLEGAGIDVGAGAFISSQLDVGGSVSVGGGGLLSFLNGVRFYNGAGITTGGGSNFNVSMGMSMEEDTRFVNGGLVYLDGWEASLDLYGEIVNQSGGHISLWGDPININGVFRNEGEVNISWGALNIGGEFNNQGSAHTDGSGNEVNIRGNWTGNPLEYR